MEMQTTQIVFIKTDRSLVGIIKSNQQVSHRGFTYTAPPENGTNGSGCDMKRDVVEDRQVFVTEADIFKRDVAACLFERNGVEIVTDFNGSIKQFKKAA